MPALSYISKLMFVAIITAIGSFYAGFHVASDKVLQLETEIQRVNDIASARTDLIIAMSYTIRDLMIDLTYGNHSLEDKKVMIKTISEFSSLFGELD